MNGEGKEERERERERTEREKVIRTSREPLHMHIDRAYYSDWACSLGIIVRIRTYASAVFIEVIVARTIT